MVEQLIVARRVPAYESVLNGLTQRDLKKAETIKKGTIGKILSALEANLGKENEPIYPRIVLVHEITKATIDEKIRKKINNKNAIDAIQACINLAMSVYYGDQNALTYLKAYETLIENSEFKNILKKRVEEKADLKIAPERAGEEDLISAENLLKETKGAPILAIGINHRGFRRAMDLFLDYRCKSDIPDSIFWPIRFSHRDIYGDFLPKVSEEEKKFLTGNARGRKIVVISPTDVFPFRKQSGKAVLLDRLQVSRDYLSQIILGSEREPAKIIPVPILLSELG